MGNEQPSKDSGMSIDATSFASSSGSISECKSNDDSLQQIVSQTLEEHKSADINEFINDVMEAIVEQYENNELSFVPNQNIISDIDTKYQYIKQLGHGASCCVFKARHIKNHHIYAIKEIYKSNKFSSNVFRKEVKLLKKLHHPNIVPYHDCYVDDKSYYIATEYCSGGTMLDKIIRMKSFSEKKASVYIKTILSAVNYMHSLNIAHRDLKARNIVFDKIGSDGKLQIIDFGDSKIVNDEEVYSEFVGTIHYVSPEITRPRTGRELKKSDLWAIGVIAYILVCGRPPFEGENPKEILLNITSSKNKKIKYPKGKGIDLSDSCKDFIEKLLCYNTEDRMDAESALKHEWISGSTASVKDLGHNVLENLKQYKHNNKLNKLENILVNAMLTRMKSKEQDALNQGIFILNRQISDMNSHCIVNYLLLHSSVKQLSSNKMDLSMLKMSPKASQSISKHQSHFSEDLDWDCLNGLDVDNILAEVDQKEKELEESLAIKMDDNNSNNGRISIDRFRGIMEKSDTKYNVDHIINDLNDGNGYIPLKDIASYTKTIETI